MREERTGWCSHHADVNGQTAGENEINQIERAWDVWYERSKVSSKVSWAVNTRYSKC